MTKDFYTAIAGRRSIYGIGKKVLLADDEIEEIIQHTLKYLPSAFNSQSTRIVLLLRNHHDRLWNITKENLRKIVPADKFSGTETKIDSFRSGYGTILYFEDQTVLESMMEKYAAYSHNVATWSNHTSGMHQFVIWSALELEGLGASLQHYNEVIEEDIKKEWELPPEWKLIAQMPFGNPTAAPEEKESQPVDARMRVFK